MGYDLHITRTKEWSESENSPISIDEWRAYCASDSEFELTGVAKAAVGDGKILLYENEGLAAWTAFSGHNPNGNQAWFDHRDHRIVVKNPSEEIIHKMKSVAQKLGAFVVGDEGEMY